MLGMMLPTADEIDEPTMTRIAEITGGRYFRARSTQELAAIYAELDRLEPAAQAGDKLRPRRELYAWPLAAAVVLAFMVMLQRGWRERVPA
jgi:Ca-activated chloride channel homolog